MSFFPIDPDQMLEEHRQRTRMRTCMDMMRVGAQSGKSLAQRIKTMLWAPSRNR